MAARSYHDHMCPTAAPRLNQRPLSPLSWTIDWSFGVEGCRWIVCRAAGYVHFRVQIDGRMYHRLARYYEDGASVPAGPGSSRQRCHRCHYSRNPRRTGYHDPHHLPPFAIPIGLLLAVGLCGAAADTRHVPDGNGQNGYDGNGATE